MKTYRFLWFVFGLILQTTNLFGQSDCPNGNAENNNLGNWITYAGPAQAPNQLLTTFLPSNDNARFGVVNSTTTYGVPGSNLPNMLNNGIDYYGGFAVPSEGNYCFRLGNNAVGSQAELMSFTFTVNNTNKIFKFSYAVVLNDGAHTNPGVNPSFEYYVKLGSGIVPTVADNLYLTTHNRVVADDSNPFFKNSSKLGPSQSKVVYKGWQCVTLDLSNFVGQQVTFVAMTRDCTETGHFGYAYLDGLCQNWPAVASMTLNGTKFCPNHVITMNGINSSGDDRYVIEITECNVFGVPIVGGSFYSEKFYTSVPNNIDISNLYTVNGGKKFECGKYYRVKLRVMNDCSPANETSSVIQIQCLNIDQPNQDICCGSPTTIGLPQHIQLIIHGVQFLKVSQRILVKLLLPQPLQQFMF